MQVCTLLQADNHASTPPLSFLQAGCPSYRPTNSVRALKAVYVYQSSSIHCTHNITSLQQPRAVTPAATAPSAQAMTACLWVIDRHCSAAWQHWCRGLQPKTTPPCLYYKQPPPTSGQMIRYEMLSHTRFTALFSGLPGWAGTRKAKPIWVLLKQETVSGSGISWAIICKSAPRSRQITMPAPHHSVFYRPDALPAPPNQQCQSTEDATRCYYTVHWKANIGQLNLLHRSDN